jgi:hypothetical protein
MTWDAFHRRGDVLRTVAEEANRRRDGVLPLELPGVDTAFRDDADLVLALQLRWHTRLSGQIERALMEQPMDLEPAVLTAWRRTAAELAGVRAILDAQRAEPVTPEVGEALARADRKDWALLAAMAGRAGSADPTASRIGRRLEEKARAAYDPTAAPRPAAAASAPEHRAATLLGRLKAHLAA